MEIKAHIRLESFLCAVEEEDIDVLCTVLTIIALLVVRIRVVTPDYMKLTGEKHGK